MPIFLHQVVDDVRAQAERDHTPTLTAMSAEVDKAVTERFVRYVIKALGMHVATSTGEVIDPKPKPTVNFPEQRFRTAKRRW